MYLVPGGGGVYLVWGGLWGEDVSALGGMYLVLGGVPGPRGVYLALGVYLVLGCVPSQVPPPCEQYS